MRLKFEFYLYNKPIYFVLYASIGDLNIKSLCTYAGNIQVYNR